MQRPPPPRRVRTWREAVLTGRARSLRSARFDLREDRLSDLTEREDRVSDLTEREDRVSGEIDRDFGLRVTARAASDPEIDFFCRPIAPPVLPASATCTSGWTGAALAVTGKSRRPPMRQATMRRR